MKPLKKKILKSIKKEIKEILYDPIIDRDEKTKEIKKLAMSLVATTLNIKVMEIKIKLYQLKIILMKLGHT